MKGPRGYPPRAFLFSAVPSFRCDEEPYQYLRHPPAGTCVGVQAPPVRMVISPAMLVSERMSSDAWMPPWVRYQHEARYEFAAACAGAAEVLDAACGTGYGSILVRNAGASRVVGVDIAVDAVREAMRSDSPPQADFILGSALSFPFRDAQFDLFISLETIEHIDDDRSYVREARRVVKPGGTFICSTPNRAVLNPGRSLFDRPFNPFHIREYAQPELDRLLREQFRTIRWYGQTLFDARYIALLSAIGRRVPMLAVRLHQMHKVLRAAFDKPRRHAVQPLPTDGAHAEVFVAVCTD